MSAKGADPGAGDSGAAGSTGEPQVSHERAKPCKSLVVPLDYKLIAAVLVRRFTNDQLERIVMDIGRLVRKRVRP